MADSRSTDFGVFYAATATRVVGYLYVVLGDITEAEDAAHEAYARAWQRWSKVRDYDDPEAWVRTVAYRVAMNSWRKAKNRLVAHRRSENSTRRDNPDPSNLSSDRLVLVEALRKIPREQRRALVLFHVQGLSIAEIAHETGAPPNTVKARLARGRKAVAPYVSDADDEDAAPSSLTQAATTARSAKPADTTSGREMISNA